MNQQDFNIMLKDAIDTLTSYVMSESGAFPSGDEMRTMPKEQRMIVGEKFRAAQARALPIVREFYKNYLRKQKKEYEKNVATLTHLLDSVRVTEGPNFSINEIGELLSEGLIEDMGLLKELSVVAMDNNNRFLDGGRRRRASKTRSRRPYAAKTRGGRLRKQSRKRHERSKSRKVQRRR